MLLGFIYVFAPTFGSSTHGLLFGEDVTLQLRVHIRHSSSSNLGLEVPQILRPEQELPVEVTLLDGIQIRNVNDPIRSSRKAYHTPVFQHLTSDGTGADQELPVIGDLALEFISEHGNLAIMSRVERLGVRLGG